MGETRLERWAALQHREVPRKFPAMPEILRKSQCALNPYHAKARPWHAPKSCLGSAREDPPSQTMAHPEGRASARLGRSR